MKLRDEIQICKTISHSICLYETDFSFVKFNTENKLTENIQRRYSKIV